MSVEGADFWRLLISSGRIGPKDMVDVSEKSSGGSPPIWGNFPLPGEEPWIMDYGPMRLWCKTLGGDFWMACARSGQDASGAGEGDKAPKDEDWSRWAVNATCDKLRLSPIFPDRSIVVVPESFFILKPGSHARVFVRCPLWVNVELLNKSPFPITEIPVVKLPNTWFGSFTEGELCYWMSSGAKRSASPDPARPFHAICPIEIKNSSEEDLMVEKICLRVGGLSLYEQDGQIWADEMEIAFRGKDSISSLKASGKAPAEAPKATLVAAPHDPVRRSFAAKTFSPLKGLPGFGFLET
jgi:hypothetical protein